ncbi:hypothetical protein QVN60_01965 [Yersinia aleksiciae]|uniref:hypothetical protein n=1 Tax=Yersinia aleksiciae TaxID=263819 RepID=UPI0021BDA758|nr:hypothetical protein [Yersinia aleksiciae]MDN0121983.1 hypothetical protein [Yersinia aleksiciae]
MGQVIGAPAVTFSAFFFAYPYYPHTLFSLSVFASQHRRFTEAPHQTAAGDWKFNLQGIAAGDVNEIVTEAA